MNHSRKPFMRSHRSQSAPGLTGYITTDEADRMTCSNMGEGDNCLRGLSDYVALSGAAVDVTPLYIRLGNFRHDFHWCLWGSSLVIIL